MLSYNIFLYVLFSSLGWNDPKLTVAPRFYQLLEVTFFVTVPPCCLRGGTRAAVFSVATGCRWLSFSSKNWHVPKKGDHFNRKFHLPTSNHQFSRDMLVFSGVRRLFSFFGARLGWTGVSRSLEFVCLIFCCEALRNGISYQWDCYILQRHECLVPEMFYGPSNYRHMIVQVRRLGRYFSFEQLFCYQWHTD